MTDLDPSPADIGRQLAQRREDLDLTQQELAHRIGISARTVSAVERGLNRITKGRRTDWEHALDLAPGTIGRAYRDGTPIVTATVTATLPALQASITAHAHDELKIGDSASAHVTPAGTPDAAAVRAAELRAEAARLLEMADQLDAGGGDIDEARRFLARAYEILARLDAR